MLGNITGSQSYEGYMISVKVPFVSCFNLRSRTIFLLVCIILWASQVSNAQNVQSSFTVSALQGCVPFNVQFTNTSVNAVSYQWDFGNGNTSTQVHPGNVYTVAGTYLVSLTASGSSGSQDVFTVSLTVHPKPVAQFSVSNSSGCQNSQVFTFQNLSTSFDSCIWDFGDGTTSNQWHPQHIYSIPGIFNVTLVVYNRQFGCSDVKVMPAVVDVYPSPTAVITVNDTSTCNPGFSFQFNALMSNAVSWTWMFGDGNQSNLLNPSHVYADTGYFDVGLVMTSSNGCTDTVLMDDLVHIKWNPVPVVTLSADSGCIPHYLAMQTAYYPQTGYQWDLGNGITRNGSSVYYTYATAGIFPITLTVSYSSGCQQTVSAGPVYAFDRPVFTYGMTNNNGCAPLTVQFVNNNAAANYTWLWDFGDGTTSALPVPTHTYSSAGIYQVSLTATSPSGCTHGFPLSDKVRVFAPSAAFTADLISGCPPLTVNFTNNSSGASSFFWDFGDGTTSTVQHPSHVYVSNGTYSVSLIVTDATGCSDTLVYPSLIQVAPTVVNYQVPPPISGCAPHPVNFSDASGASSFLWDFGDGSTSTLANPYHVYTEPGVYVVSLTTWMVNGGCEQHIPVFQTFIIDGADPGFTYSISPCPPYQVFFNDTSLNASAWQWTFGDGGSSSLQNPVHAYPGPGSYNVSLTVTTPGGCITTLQANNAVQISGLGASASASTIDTVPPLHVQFQANSSGATWWLWSFGDGDSSSLEDPLHVYQTAGPFVVTLTLGNDSCSYTYTYPPITFGSSFGSGGGGLGGPPPPPPPRVYNCAPFTVSFNNPDPYASAWLWDFGDGTTSSLASPEHIYTDSGAFVTTLYLFYGAGVIDTIIYSDTLYVVEPITDFNISTTNLCNGVIVTVQSFAPALSYDWDFGNGNSFNTPTASNTYPNINASYMVSLNAVDTNNCPSFVAKSFAVNATSPLSANTRRTCAGDSVAFDPGNVNYAQYLWDFGDGIVSSTRNPLHAYQDSGLYAVTLTVTDINGCQLTFNLAYSIEVFDPVAGFTFTPPLTNCTTLYAAFTNTSTGSNSWFWTFGDGTSSNQFEPTHTWSTPGYYDITLIAFKNICRDSLVLNDAVYVSDLVPSFNYNISSDCVPAVASFTDLSMDAVKWHWDFGDGDTSDLQHPVHIYLSNPTDSITLTVTDINGCVKSVSLPSPQITSASFSVGQDGGCVPFTVAFNDSSTNVSAWEWHFGDGQTSVVPNPSHVYMADGFYSVTLIVSSAGGCKDTLSIDSLIEVNTPIAAFVADSITGCSPLLVNYADQSTNAVSWLWDFGNGGTSGNQFPSLIYTTPGYFDVELLVENKFGCRDSVTHDSLIYVQGPITTFSVSSVSGCAPLHIVFNNTTQGAVAWEWSFGDGITDSVEFPVHVYQDPGTYTVTLFAYDSIGCSTIFTYPVPLAVGAAPVLNYTVDVTTGCSPLQIQINSSASQADSLVWDMGDGTRLQGDNPVYTYTQPGDYIISLIAYTAEGCSDTLAYVDTIHVYAQPDARFTSDLTQGCSPVPVNFTNLSSGVLNPVYEWEFGNGITSSLENPSFVYVNSGIYSVTLIVTNSNGCSDTILKTDYIEVFDQNPPPITSLYHVTVNAPDDVLLEWQLSNAHDLDYYVVYRFDNMTGVYDSIAQVFQTNTGINGNIPYYNDNSVTATASTYSYKVQSVDKCGLRQDLAVLEAHETILLHAASAHQQVSLQWNLYGGCQVLGYDIYRKDQNGLFQWLGFVDSTTTSFIDSTAACPVEYTYKIVAASVCGNPLYTSSSNEASATPTSDIGDQFVDIVRSTVVDDQFVLTEWAAPAILPQMVDRFDIYRSTDQMNYQLIASVPNTAHEYSDFDTDVDNQEYYYKVITQNICNVATREGLNGSSVLLQKLEVGTGYILKWTKYQEWFTGVETYVVEKLNSMGMWEEVQRLPGDITEWEEK